jgi:hypothetical protein
VAGRRTVLKKDKALGLMAYALYLEAAGKRSWYSKTMIRAMGLVAYPLYLEAAGRRPKDGCKLGRLVGTSPHRGQQTKTRAEKGIQ